MFAGWEFGILLQVLGPQRAAHGVFLGEPFPQIHELAAMGTEGTVLAGEPIASPAARGTFDLRQSAHVRLQSAPHFGADGFQIVGHADGGETADAPDLQDGLRVFDDLVELRGGGAPGIAYALDILRQPRLLFGG